MYVTDFTCRQREDIVNCFNELLDYIAELEDRITNLENETS